MNDRASVLVIAGSDSSGGAGLSRDLRVLADCDVAGVAVVTAVTAQTHAHVQSIHVVPPELIREQIAAALEANDIGAIKIGMLGTRASVEAVARSLPVNDAVPVVLDPVLAASSGRALLDEAGRVAMRELLLANVTLITPNIPEAAALLGKPLVEDEHALIEYALRLREMGPQAVLIKGGHAARAECVDLLVCADGEVVRMVSQRIGSGMRGTGCALASAIAAGLARGLPLAYACRFAKNYLTSQLQERANRV